MNASSKPSTLNGGEAHDATRPRAHAPDPAALADLFACLAHDLRSPLGVVSEAIAELRADFSAALTDDHRLLLSLSNRGLQRLGRTADTLSLAAAIEAGTFQLKRWPVDLIGVLRNAAATAAALEPRREVELICELPEEPCPALVDAATLSRAVSEIMSNAIRHARRTVRVRVEIVSGETRVAIEDDGQGVAAEQRATLFRRFASCRSRSGLGMGLSIAHDVIIAHGGRLELAASTLPPGCPGTIGARFVISLPIEKKEQLPAQAA
jgi:signal transduction histidine kinase